MLDEVRLPTAQEIEFAQWQNKVDERLTVLESHRENDRKTYVSKNERLRKHLDNLTAAHQKKNMRIAHQDEQIKKLRAHIAKLEGTGTEGSATTHTAALVQEVSE